MKSGSAGNTTRTKLSKHEARDLAGIVGEWDHHGRAQCGRSNNDNHRLMVAVEAPINCHPHRLNR